MNAILFDTLKLFRTLRDKGHFSPEQAETLAEALGEAQHGELATKADLAAVQAALELKISQLATKAELAEVKADILKWIVGAIGFQTVVIVGALITLVRIFVK
jgi:hypothetical protein